MRPIYIDFESNKNGEVFLAGYQIDGNFRQIILNPKLTGLAKARNLECLPYREFCDWLVKLASAEDRPIAAYSMQESKALREACPNATFRYLNLAKASRRWIKRYRFEEFKRQSSFQPNSQKFEKRRATWSLASVAQQVSMTPGTWYARGKTTARLSVVIEGLDKRGGDYERLTSVQKSKASKALRHNRFDVEALPRLVNAITNDDAWILERSVTQSG